ncbi:MAG: ParB/RepB/Spo0J family partition protein [Pseudomonadales bacterium]|nr:ParB/RepB/Spo0J family partition protein [Candidatus Woesebacteria bacterium]MCB9802116.1 ParB/RepB/Spo0J family partition protein [Pseudomonadales bacterium]
MSDAKLSIQLLAVETLQPNPYQPRSYIEKEDIAELADSIKQYGILEPIVVAQTPAGHQIVAGERRWRAAQMAGLTEVPVVLRKTTRKEMLELAIIENVQRIDLSAVERAKAFQQLKRDFGYSVGEIAKKVSKSSSYVSNSLRLLELPDAVTDGLVSGQITEGHARALLGLHTTSDMIAVFKTVLAENLTVRDTEQAVRSYLDQREEGEPRRIAGPKVLQVDDQALKQWKTKLDGLLKAHSNVRVSRSARATKITITLKGDLETTQRDLDVIMGLGSKL